jgi:hypothetical protein
MDNALTVKMTPAEVNLVLAALAELPLKVAAPLYNSLKTQAEAQLNPGPTLVKDES